MESSFNKDNILKATKVAVAGGVTLAVAAEIPANADTHNVSEGETLSEIAEDYGVDQDAIVHANETITNPDLIYAGQDIEIPESTMYKVREGDNVYSIAKKFLGDSAPESRVQELTEQVIERHDIPTSDDGKHALIRPGDMLDLSTQDVEDEVEDGLEGSGFEDRTYDDEPSKDSAKEVKIEIPQGGTLSGVAVELKNAGEFQDSSVGEIVEKLAEDSDIEDVDFVTEGQEVVVSGTTLNADEVDELQEEIEESAAESSVQVEAPIANTDVKESTANTTRKEADNPESYDGLLSPPNLGPVNSEGYYRMPENPDLYLFSDVDFPLKGMSGSPPESRCGPKFMIDGLYTIATKWNANNPNNKLIIGDLNEADGHVSHRTGVDFDLYDELMQATGVYGNQAKMFELSDYVLDVFGKDLEFILYNDAATIEYFNQEAIKRGLSARMFWAEYHDEHWHGRLKPKHKGVYSEKCAPDTQDYSGPEVKNLRNTEVKEVPEQINVEAGGAYEHLSESFHEVMDKRPSLDIAKREYDLWVTGDTGPKIEILDVAILAYEAGWRGEDLAIAIALGAHAEGGSAPFVTNGDAGRRPEYHNDTVAVGLWQVLYAPGNDWGVVEERNPNTNLDPFKNAEHAYKLWQEGGWDLWEAVLIGSHNKFMDKSWKTVYELEKLGFDVN